MAVRHARPAARRSLEVAVVVALAVPLLALPSSTASASTCPSAATGYAGGDGSVGGPYRIATVAQLLRLGLDSGNWDKAFVLTADLDLETCIWSEIGSPSSRFVGSFDGGGHTVRNLGVSVPLGGALPEAFFGDVGVATIEDLRIEDAEISGGSVSGVLARSARGSTIRNVHVSGSVIAGSAGGSAIGGLIGSLENDGATGSVIEDSSADVHVTLAVSGPGNRVLQRVGGLVGSAVVGTPTGPVVIRRSFATGRVRGTDAGDDFSDQVGGLVGELDGATISASYATGEVTTEESAGGLVGVVLQTYGPAVVDASFATGRVSASGANVSVGGLIGYVDAGSGPSGSISASYATGAVSGTGDVGGLVGIQFGTAPIPVSDSFWDEETSGTVTSDGGTGKTTAEMTAIATFSDTSTVGLSTAWDIVPTWRPFVTGQAVWSLCPAVNDGYPFLLWRYGSDPCVGSTPVATPTLSVSCTTLAPGASADCAVSGADPGIDLVWRAAYNPVFAEGVVRTGPDGTGTFSFVVPLAAAGSPVSVELVAWTAPIVVGTAQGPVPSSIPAGEGRVPLWLLFVVTLAGGLTFRRGSRSVRTMVREV